MDEFKNKIGMTFNEYYTKTNTKAFGWLFCKKTGGTVSDIEDALQEAWISLFKNINNFDKTKASIDTYFYRICLNSLYSILKHKPNNVDIDEIYSIQNEDEVVDKEPLYNQLEAIIEGLDESDRIILEMKLNGYKLREIANELNINFNTLKSRYYALIKSHKTEKRKKKRYYYRMYNGHYIPNRVKKKEKIYDRDNRKGDE
jgi:RNA polymerase sigma factor (sigma-70 family)